MSIKNPDQIDIYVGGRIRSLRNSKGLSQTALATNLGVTFQQVQKYEKGVNRVGAGRLSRIAALLDATVSEFYPPDANGSVENVKRAAKRVADDPFVKMSQSKRGHRLARAFIKLGLVDSLVVVSVAEALSVDREKS
jgi:transcriptional regulator with XRE-family HTH domain